MGKKNRHGSGVMVFKKGDAFLKAPRSLAWRQKIASSLLVQYKEGKRDVRGKKNPMFGKKRPDNIERNKLLIKEGKLGFKKGVSNLRNILGVNNPNYGNGEKLRMRYREHPEDHPLFGYKPYNLTRTIEEPVKDALVKAGCNYLGNYHQGQKYDFKDFVHNYPVVTKKTIRFIDFAFPRQRIALEADSDYFHKGEKNKQRDFERMLELFYMGWRVLRLDEEEIKNSERLSFMARDLMEYWVGFSPSELPEEWKDKLDRGIV